MKQFNPILFDFVNIKLTFQKDGKSIELQGITQEAELKMITTEKILKLLQ